MMLISAGADTIIQKATTGEVNWGQVAVSGAFGAVGGGFGAAIGKHFVGNAVEGAVENVANTVVSGQPVTPGSLLRNAAEGAATSAATGGVLNKAHLPSAVGKLGDERPQLEGIVYRRIDRNGDLKPYIGQSRSLDLYDRRRADHFRNFPDADLDFEIIDRAHPGVELDRLEEYYIRKEGGPTNKSNPDGLLSNKRHQMSEMRYMRAGGDPR
jgi:hypothetical protein